VKAAMRRSRPLLIGVAIALLASCSSSSGKGASDDLLVFRVHDGGAGTSL
jgi:outer membrane biogenesis lipoprotein LolB